MRPTAAVIAQLLADLLCHPVGMRAPEHSLFVQSLIKGHTSLADVRAEDTGGEDSEPWSWELPIYEVVDGVALVQVFGKIVKGYDDFTCWYFGLMSTDRLQRAIDELAARSDVAAVLFWLNTPGGSSAGMPETADAIVALGESKLTVAFSADTAASNGYRLAAACRQIFCTRSAVLGSIGTYLAFYDYTEMLTAAGIKLELLVRGKYKAAGVAGKPLSDDQRAFLDEWVGRCDDLFKTFVTARRPGVSADTMQGQWFDGEQAVTLALADRLVSGLPELLAELRASISPARAAAI
jgi:ClpP class serine protease